MDPGDWQNIDPLPLPFLVMLVFWLTLLFGSFGLLLPERFGHRHALDYVPSRYRPASA